MNVFETVFLYVSERPTRVTTTLYKAEEESHKATFLLDHCLFTHSSVTRWPPSFSTSLPNDRSKWVAVPSGGGNDRYRCHLNCVTHWPPNWTVLALPYAQDVEGIAPDVHRSCLKFCARVRHCGWWWGTLFSFERKRQKISIYILGRRGLTSTSLFFKFVSRGPGVSSLGL